MTQNAGQQRAEIRIGDGFLDLLCSSSSKKAGSLERDVCLLSWVPQCRGQNGNSKMEFRIQSIPNYN